MEALMSHIHVNRSTDTVQDYHVASNYWLKWAVQRQDLDQNTAGHGTTPGQVRTAQRQKAQRSMTQQGLARHIRCVRCILSSLSGQ